MKENHSENLERDFFSFFYSALFSYLFFHSTLLVKEIYHGLAAVNHKDGHDSPKQKVTTDCGPVMPLLSLDSFKET